MKYPVVISWVLKPQLIPMKFLKYLHINFYFDVV